MPLGVELRLYDDAGTAQASLTGIQACWWDVEELFDINTRPIGKSDAVTTDADGDITLNLSGVSGLASGDYGYLALYKLDATDHRDSLIFSGKVQTSTVSSGVDMYYYDSGWTRPAGWLTFTAPTTSEEKFIGLHQVYEEGGNFVALSAAGAYTVNWGDGTGNQNIATGVTAQTNILWANVGADTDVGIVDAVACTFTDTGDTVGLTGHNYKNGEKVAFNTIVSTTGISIRTTYWVRDAATDTFKVASSQDGSALALTTNGTGTVYRPKFRQAIVTVVPQGGQQLTALNLHLKHSQSGLQAYASGFIDIAISGQYLTDLRIGVRTPGSFSTDISHNLEKVNIVRSNVKNAVFLFNTCRRLRHITDIATSTDAASTASVTFQDSGDTVTHIAHGKNNGDPVIFSSITSTTGISVAAQYFIANKTTDTYQLVLDIGGGARALTTDGSGTAVYGTSFNSMFTNCNSLQTIPLFNTASGTSFSSMFSSCSALQTIPLLNTAAGTNFGDMFNSCYSLQSIPLFNTAAGTNFQSMLSGCSSLQSIPLLNTAAGTNFQSMFNSCYSLQTIPLFNTAAGTNFSNMFNNCYSLQSIPLLNTAAGTNFGSMLSGCSSIQSIPLLNTAAGTNFSYMFNSCSSLQSIPLLNTAAGTNFSYMFSTCFSLEVGALSNTKANIDYTGSKLSGTELDRIYTNLGTLPSGAVTFQVATDTVTQTSHGVVANQPVSFTGISGTTNISNGVTYFARDITTDTFKLSTSVDGAVRDLTGSNGTGTFGPRVITVSNNWGTATDTPSIATAKGWQVTG